MLRVQPDTPVLNLPCRCVHAGAAKKLPENKKKKEDKDRITVRSVSGLFLFLTLLLVSLNPRPEMKQLRRRNGCL